MAEPTAPGPLGVSRDRSSEPGPGLEESARWLGHLRWIELRLFEQLGCWVAEIPELEVKLRVAEHAHHHAWHAELSSRLLPTLPDRDAATLTVPADAGIEAFVDALGSAVGAEATIEKLVGVYRVLLPRLVAAYTWRLDRANPVADAPLMRWLGFTLQDELRDWRDGELLVQGLLDSPEAVRRAADHQARLEALLVAAGGLLGRDGPGAAPLHAE